MGLRKETLVITDEGRDKGRTYLLLEMPSEQAEWWAIRLLLAAGQAGLDIDELAGGAASGMAGVAAIGLRALLRAMLKSDPATVKPLLDEMMGCVTYQHRPGVERVPRPEDLEEVATRLALRKAVFHLHAGFSKAADTPTTG